MQQPAAEEKTTPRRRRADMYQQQGNAANVTNAETAKPAVEDVSGTTQKMPPIRSTFQRNAEAGETKQVKPVRPVAPASPVSSPQPPHCAGRCCESAASSVSCPTHLPRRASPFLRSSHLPRFPAAGTYLRGGGAAWSFLRQLAAARIYPDNYSDPKRLYSFAPLVALRHTPIIP